MDAEQYEKMLRAMIEQCAKIAETKGRALGEPAIGAAIARSIRELKE